MGTYGNYNNETTTMEDRLCYLHSIDIVKNDMKHAKTLAAKMSDCPLVLFKMMLQENVCEKKQL